MTAAFPIDLNQWLNRLPAPPLQWRDRVGIAPTSLLSLASKHYCSQTPVPDMQFGYFISIYILLDNER
ncbi:hypothetical protein JCM10914_4311 [Paenibacillus sp. JCM 10914]|nr:hypothetical protein JCM10914_4311 [Paenibacillus sp. JCM 10914]